MSEVRSIALRTGVELAVAEAGAGGRPFLLVHGFTGAKEDFTDWLAPLAELGWHAIAVDQRGHGESSKPADEGEYSFEAFAGDLLALLDALDLPQVTLLGHSMGGMVAQTAVLQAPERFSGLVLMDTSHRPLRGLDPELLDLALAIVRTEGMAALKAALEALPEESRPLGTPAHEQLVATRPGYRELGDRKLLAAAPAMWASMMRIMTDRTSGLDRLDDLKGVDVPTLVMVGEQDRPFIEPSKRMAEVIPDAELAVIPGGGHSPQFESPKEWWQALSSFLARMSA